MYDFLISAAVAVGGTLSTAYRPTDTAVFGAVCVCVCVCVCVYLNERLRFFAYIMCACLGGVFVHTYACVHLMVFDVYVHIQAHLKRT
jgi:hypothetical protein